MPVWGEVNHRELSKTLERQRCRSARIIFGFLPDMPTIDALATVQWRTLTQLYKCSLIKLIMTCSLDFSWRVDCLRQQIFYKTETMPGLIAPRFASKYFQKPISYRGAVLWNAIGRSNGSMLECTEVKFFLKNVVTCHTFKDFNFNVSAPQVQRINNRSENFIYF